MKSKKLLAAGLALTLLLAVQAQAQTFTYADNWINWPGYTSSLGDENGWPQIDKMVVDINDNNQLNSVTIYVGDFLGIRQMFDSLFISTGGAWDSWDYFVHDGDSTNSINANGKLPGDGLWSVNADYDYTTAINSGPDSDPVIVREGNPNGIDADSLGKKAIDSGFGGSHARHSREIKYDFTTLKNQISIDPDEFFVAYAPFCANDVIGGGTAPVPEPATMLLFGTGLAGLASVGRKKMKRA